MEISKNQKSIMKNTSIHHLVSAKNDITKSINKSAYFLYYNYLNNHDKQFRQPMGEGKLKCYTVARTRLENLILLFFIIGKSFYNFAIRPNI